MTNKNNLVFNMRQHNIVKNLK